MLFSPVQLHPNIFNFFKQILFLLYMYAFVGRNVTVNLVRQEIWSKEQNSQEKLVHRTEFPNFVHTEISLGMRNLVWAVIIHDSITPASTTNGYDP